MPTIILPVKTQTQVPEILISPTPWITPTFGFIEGVMLEYSSCLESFVYERWGDVVRFAQKGEHIIILGKNDSGRWLNIKNESGTYCGVLEKSTSCWVEAKDVSINTTPPPLHWYHVEMTVTKTDGSSYKENGLESGYDYNTVWQSAIDRCKLRQAEGSTCTYVIKTTCK
jgi:hypothetical protein